MLAEDKYSSLLLTCFAVLSKGLLVLIFNFYFFNKLECLFQQKITVFLQGIISFLFIGLYWCNKLECFNLQDYNISVNPTVENAVGVAAFRFGHSQIRSNLIKLFTATINEYL